MKKLSIIIITVILFISLIGCQKKTEISPMDVAKSISDIYTDPEGNVTIQLLDGRNFYLGNMKGPQGERGLQGEKGEKGDKGDKGEKGDVGPQGPAGASGSNGRDGINGLNGKDGINGKDGEIPTDYVTKVRIGQSDKMFITYGDGTEEYVDRVQTKGKFKIIPVYHAGDKTWTETSQKDPAYTWADEGDKVTVQYYSYCNNNTTLLTPRDATYRLEKAKLGSKELKLVGRDAYTTRFEIDSMPGSDTQVDFYYEPYSGCYVPKNGSSLEDVQAWFYDYSQYIDYFQITPTKDQALINTFIFKRSSTGEIIPNGSKLESFGTEEYAINYYIEDTHTLSISTSQSNKKMMTLKANYDTDSSFVSWDYSSSNIVSFSTQGDLLTVTSLNDKYFEEIVINAYTNYKSAQITIYAYDGEISTVDEHPINIANGVYNGYSEAQFTTAMRELGLTPQHDENLDFTDYGWPDGIVGNHGAGTYHKNDTIKYGLSIHIEPE